MSVSKKNGARRIFSVIAIVAVVAGAAFVFRFHRPGKSSLAASDSAPRPAASQTPAATTTPGPAAPQPSATTPAPRASQNQLSQSPSLPSPTAPAAPGAPGSTAPTGAADENASGLATALASLPPSQRAALEKIPSARFREDVLRLAPGARARVFKVLAAKPIPDADYASLHIMSDGMLYYVCQMIPSTSRATGERAPGEPAPAGIPTDAASGAAKASDTVSAPDAASVTAPGEVPVAAPVRVDQPPVRHSRPGASRILFLDFGGMNVAGTAWNEADLYGKVDSYLARPYDTDNNINTFNDQEQKDIVQIWEHVAEDFAPFDVDVTTEKPAGPTRTTAHALITNSIDERGTTMPAGQTAGGVGLLNVFGECEFDTKYSPVFIYYDNLGKNTRNIAYAVSHELGHNLGLSHDGPGDTLGDGDPHGYYTGHGANAISWAPIMGAGYGKNIVQWSKGEYRNANNHEDDIAIIEGKLGYREEIAPVALANATALAIDTSGHLMAAGILRHDGDAHYYNINTISSAYLMLTLDPCRYSSTPDDAIIGNAHLRLDIQDSAGASFATANPTDQTNANLSTQLPAGQWYIRISSKGAGSPMSAIPSGYTAYGSIGQYTLGTNLIRANPTLAAALNSDLTWTPAPGSSAEWFGQAQTTHDNIAAAQSGPVAQDQTTGIITTVEGAGTLSFWWKISAGANDYLTFVTADAGGQPPPPDAYIAGQQDWQQRTFTIGTTGTHTFCWTFDRADTPENPLPTVTGSAWIDQVVWTPTGLVFDTTPATREIYADSGQFSIAIETNKTWTATTDADWLAFADGAPTATGGGNATLAITHGANDTPATRRATVTITSAGINRTCEIIQPGRIALATALDNSLAWETGGDNKWTTQTITTHDGRHAARSGIIFGTSHPNGATGQQTWLQTTVNGPGTLSFWWKVSSEEEASDETGTWGDILHFTINGEERTRTSGEKDWALRTISITETGPHTLRWTYHKDPYFSAANDGAWLDQVLWTTGLAPTLNISPAGKQVAATTGQFTIAIDTTAGWNVPAPPPWMTISPRSGDGPGVINVTHLANTATTARTGIITVTAGDLSDTCTVTQAAAPGTDTSANNNNNNNSSNTGGGGGGGGAPSLWSLLALGLLYALRKTQVSHMRRRNSKQ